MSSQFVTFRLSLHYATVTFLILPSPYMQLPGVKIKDDIFSYLTQRLAITILLAVSLFLIIFNVLLILPIIYPTPNSLKLDDSLPETQLFKGAKLTLNETQIRKLMHQRELKSTPSPEEPELILDYSQKKFYPFTINPWHLCQDSTGQPESVYLLLVIKSSTSQFSRRQAIRQTWGDTHKLHLNIDQTGHFNRGMKIFSADKSSKVLNIKRLFLLAKGEHQGKEELLKMEANEYGDILQGDFQDSFRNLTLKDIMFLDWQRRYCSQVQFIFKGDDDVFVNVFNIMRYMHNF